VISIVAPAIEAEVNYRYERITEDYRRARSHRRSRNRRTTRPTRHTGQTATARHA
jgi:hypothetical protein